VVEKVRSEAKELSETLARLEEQVDILSRPGDRGSSE